MEPLALAVAIAEAAILVVVASVVLAVACRAVVAREVRGNFKICIFILAVKKFKKRYNEEDFIKPEKHQLDLKDMLVIFVPNLLLLLCTIFIFVQRPSETDTNLIAILILVQPITLIVSSYRKRLKFKNINYLIFGFTFLWFLFSFATYLDISSFEIIKKDVKIYRLPFLVYIFIYSTRYVFKYFLKQEPIPIQKGDKLGSYREEFQRKISVADFIHSAIIFLSILPLMYLTFKV
ncbi:MAG: hypothetical protein JNJ41_18425 [Bacteroidia bacterium]|nr:hypothetical protein [Bacteroidia bacterium]